MSRGENTRLPASNLKYAPGTAARVPPNQRPLRVLEWLVLGHVGIYLVGITWAFGGGMESLRTPFAWWGSLGGLLTLTAIQERDAWREGAMRPLRWLWPWLGFNALVLVACLNPSLREVRFGVETRLAITGGKAGWPSTAEPGIALHALWSFDAIWISCFNLALVIRQRRALRLLLFLATLNALALAVFGTVQKLSHATGLFFDAVPSPQVHFFSTFIYHNHWGAFAVLMAALCLGLVWHYGRRREARDFFHTPAFGGLIVVLIIAASVPLSSSRSCSAVMLLLLGGAFLHWSVRLVSQRRHFRESVALPLAGAVAAVLLAGAGIWFVARDTIEKRALLTRDQFGAMLAQGSVGSRAVLYGDTWRMARDKLWFGWGMASYPRVFMLYNSQERGPVDRLPHYFHDAHSDWLQSFAEHGVIGTTLAGLCGLVPLLRLRRRQFTSPLPVYLLTGCALILLYAWVEFPFGNLAVVLSWWLCFFCAIHYARLHDREGPPARRSLTADSPPAAA